MALFIFIKDGLTGKDMPNICAKYVIGEKYKLPYFPDHMAHRGIFESWWQILPAYEKRRESKSSSRSMSILLNSVPSFLLHQSLKQLIKEVPSSIYAYQGKDKLRAIQFLLLRDDKYEADAEGEK